MEQKRILKVIEKTSEEHSAESKEQAKPKIARPNQTNPIYKNLAKFTNAKIGDKWSIKDLLR